MPREPDLDALLRNPAGATRLQIERALSATGWVRRRGGKHQDVWTKPGYPPVPLPHRLRATGTKRQIIRQIVDAREAGNAP